jgi:hypothetical protein
MVKNRAMPGFFIVEAMPPDDRRVGTPCPREHPHQACHTFRAAGRRIKLHAANKAPPTITVFTGVERN